VIGLSAVGWPLAKRPGSGTIVVSAPRLLDTPALTALDTSETRRLGAAQNASIAARRSQASSQTRMVEPFASGFYRRLLPRRPFREL